MPFVVEQNEPLDPANERLFGSVGQVLHAASIGDLFEKPWLTWLWDIGTCGCVFWGVESRR